MERIAALEDALEKKSLVGIYSVFYTIAHGDPNFSTGKFRQILEYVKERGVDNFLQVYDGEEFEPEEKWDEEYWALVASSLIDNFCMERIDHLEMVGKKVYPIKKIEKIADMQENTMNERAREMHPQDRASCQQKGKISQRAKITDEQKRRVKIGHQTRERKDDGGFLNMIFGRK